VRLASLSLDAVALTVVEAMVSGTAEAQAKPVVESYPTENDTSALAPFI